MENRIVRHSPSSSFAAGPGEPAMDMVKVGGPVSVVKLCISVVNVFAQIFNIPCPLLTNFFSCPLILLFTQMAKLLQYYALILNTP